MPFTFTPLAIPEVILVDARTFADDRGYFMETFKRSEFAAHGIAVEFVQDNYSYSTRGVLRGLHFQRAPQAQAKLVSVIRGEVFDVAVDLRPGSASFGRHVGIRLSDRQKQWLFVPAGFAHGFCVLSAEANVYYKASAEYAPTAEGGIIWNDPALRIPWPITDPILSAKDRQLPRLEHL